MLDELDKKALVRLMADGRTTWAELAEELKLSAPAAADRVRRLEERGVITGYTALVDAEEVGYPLLVFVAVTLGSLKGNFRGREEFLEMIQSTEKVKECHHLAGADDFLLKMRCRSTQDLEHILIERLRSLPIVTGTRTSVVLGTAKESASMTSIKSKKHVPRPSAKLEPTVIPVGDLHVCRPRLVCVARLPIPTHSRLRRRCRQYAVARRFMGQRQLVWTAAERSAHH